MPRLDLPRLPRKPILDLCQRRGWSLEELARRAGTHSRKLHDVRGYTWGTADKVAVALGHHPGMVWPEEWWELCRIYDSVPHPYVRDRYRQGVSNWRASA